MLFDSAPQRADVSDPDTERDPAVMGRALLFDWEAGAYVMDSGSPAEVTEAGAVKAWINYVVRTRVGRYAIHPADFGCSALELIGRKIPKGYALSELRRELLTSAGYCRGIREISELVYDGETVRCTVTLADGNEISEVIGLGA